MDKNSGRKQPFCFVIFKDDQVATKSVKQHWFDVMGKRCEIKTAVENREKKLSMVPGAIKTISKQNAVMIFIAILIEISKVGFQ